MNRQEKLKRVINDAIKPYLVRAIYSGFEVAILEALSKEGVVIRLPTGSPEGCKGSPEGCVLARLEPLIEVKE